MDDNTKRSELLVVDNLSICYSLELLKIFTRINLRMNLCIELYSFYEKLSTKTIFIYLTRTRIAVCANQVVIFLLFITVKKKARISIPGSLYLGFFLFPKRGLIG